MATAKDGGGRGTQLFERVLKSSGVEVCEGRALSINVDRREFQKRFRESLVSEKITPTELADEARIYFSKDPVRFDNSLAPCEAADNSATASSLWPARQNSVLCLLLGVPQMQKDFLKFTLDTLYERALTDDNATAVTYGVIQALKWQDAINEPEALLERIFELISDVPKEQQHQLVRALPEMIREHGAHPRVAARLCALYESRPELSGSVLEALAVLHVPPDVVESVRKSVLSSVPQLDVDQLCPVLDFVLRNLSESDTPIFINLLRSSEAIVLASQDAFGTSMHGVLDESVGDPNSAASLAATTTATKKSAAVVHFVDKLRVGVMTQRALGECWLKMIEATTAGAALKQIDVVFLFVCYGQLQQRHVYAAIRHAVKEACLTETLAATVLRRHPYLLKRYLNNVLEICDHLLRSPMVSAHELASAIYRELFLHYDVHVQTEVVVALLTHAGSGSPAELQNALSCVHVLCMQHAEQTAPFGFMLQALVDHLGKMSLGQARLLFRSLARVAYADVKEADTGLRDTLRIAARKQLINPNLKYKCVGMVATVAIVEAMLPKASKSLSSSDQAIGDAQACIRQAFDCAYLFPAAAALLCDELALAVPHLQEGLVQWLHQFASKEFRRSFVQNTEAGDVAALGNAAECSTSTVSNSTADVPKNDVSFGDSSAKIDINIYRLSAFRDRSQACGLPIEAMCPLFRLLRAAENECFSKDLQGIRALLFARTLPDDLEETSLSAAPDEDHLLTALFHTINWSRELINSASEDMSQEIRAQLLKATQRQVALTQLASQWLARVPDFVPPRVAFEDNTSAQNVHVRTAVKSKAPKGRKRKAQDEAGDEFTSIKSLPPVEFSSFRSFLRGLDLNFTHLLEEELSPTELAFLLQELQLQLDACLGIDEPQRVSFLPTASKKDSAATRRPPVEVMRFVINFIPQLSSLQENLVLKMQTFSERNGDKGDGDAAMDDGEAGLTADEVICLRLLFSIFNSLLAWKGFDDPRHAKVLRQALNMIALRVGATQFRTQCDVVEFHRRVFGYFVELAPSMSDLETAAALLRLLLTVLDRTASNADANKRRLFAVSEGFLRRSWPRVGRDKITRIAKAAQTMLSVYIEESEDRLDKVAYLAEEILPELTENPRSSTYPIIARETLTACFKTTASYFVRSVKTSCGARANSRADTNQQLSQWLKIAKVLKRLLDVVKIAATNANASCGLKTACETLDVFVKNGVAVAEASFKARTDEVLLLVKTLQQSTRVMQHTCTHFKNNAAKQIALGRQVPTARRLLETFIFKMQALFAKFDCSDAFQVGQLRMRNLRGEEIGNECPDEYEDDNEEDAADDGLDEEGADDDEQFGGDMANRLNTTDESAEF